MSNPSCFQILTKLKCCNLIIANTPPDGYYLIILFNIGQFYCSQFSRESIAAQQAIKIDVLMLTDLAAMSSNMLFNFSHIFVALVALSEPLTSFLYIFRKSTFFNVLTKSAAHAENFPFCTIGICWLLLLSYHSNFMLYNFIDLQ